MDDRKEVRSGYRKTFTLCSDGIQNIHQTSARTILAGSTDERITWKIEQATDRPKQAFDSKPQSRDP